MSKPNASAPNTGAATEPDELPERVLQGLVLMAGTLANPRPLTAELVHAWVLVLRAAGIRAAEVEPGVSRLLQTATFFPTPADLLRHLRPPEDREAAEELAWQHALTAVRRRGAAASLVPTDLAGDATALWALSRVGWERLCRELNEENRAIWRAEFIRLYRAGRQTHARLEYLPGGLEQQNRRAGQDLLPAHCGRPDWTHLPAAALPETAPAEGAPAERPLRRLPLPAERPGPE